MKTKKILLLSLLLIFVLCSCSIGKKKPDSFLVMNSTNVVYYEGDEVVYEQETLMRLLNAKMDYTKSEVHKKQKKGKPILYGYILTKEY